MTDVAEPRQLVELVGRVGELDQLAAAVGLPSPSAGPGPQPRPDPGPDGTATAVLLSGDAGIGKTRLLAELRARSESHDWTVVTGHCLDFGDSALPYLPFSEVVGRLTAEQPAAVGEVAASHPALGRLQPGRRVLGGDASDEESVGRAELFEAVHALLDGVTRAPLLLVVEDAHWADRSSRELLGFLLRRPFGHRVVVVVSYRSDDLHRRHPLRPVLAEWARIPGVERLHLEPLGAVDVRTLVGRLHPRDLPEARLRGIVDRADGNAFFVEELVDAEEAGRPAADLADLLLVRLDRLDDQARAVVRAASVAGRRVDHDQLAAASGLAPGALDAGLRAAVEGTILVAEGAGYAFRHALLAEATYDDLLPGERVRLHARYAEALQDGTASGTAAELARHARLAGEVEVAARASIRAGDEARSVGGPDEAAAHYQQAIELLTGRPVADVDLTRLSVAAAETLVDSGQAERAAALLADRVERTDDPADRARLLAARTLALLVFEADEDVVAVVDRALALTPPEPTELRAHVLAVRARTLWSFGRDGAEADGLEALELAESLDLVALANDVRMTLIGLKRAGARDVLRASLQEAVATAHASGAHWAEVRGRFLMARSFQDWGEFDAAVPWFESVVGLGERTGTPWAPYVADARYQLANVAWVRGDWDAALALVAGGGAPPPRVYAALMESVRLTVLAARGEDVRAGVAALRPQWPLDGSLVVLAAPLAMAQAAAARDVRGVLRAYDDAVAVLAPMWESPWFAGRLRLATTALAHLVDLLPQLPSADRAAVLAQTRRLVDDGHETRAHDPDASGGWGPEGDAWLLALEAEEGRLHWTTDAQDGAGPADPAALVAAWDAAATAFAELGQPGEEARVRAVLAGILRSTGDAAAGREQGDRARAIAHRLGAQPVLDRLRAVTPAPTRAGAPETLTPREQEVLALVAQGHSNGEIGRRLFISTKTVSVHVSNILGKLGTATRTEAAAVGRRRGLVEDP